MPELPRTTATGRDYLQYFAQAQDAGKPVHVYRDPAKPGSGVSRPALYRLRRDGLVELGDYRPLQGRPVHVTDLGRAVLAAHTTEN
ncbi:PadR family transcriptional regulator [Kitasatospora sp. RB6PN24]|uniref:PadR family transcriptional regulator n=1 Tax=Kitasatospora humi TaxID=2893891 RepID=UPI001E4224B8|nr:PadR family transcriptional regulator [Kitasatospora humi]MCC9307730.1 PadR family transcriptional regulator [Kitasatospora humi]